MCLRGLLPSLRRLDLIGDSDFLDLLGELALRAGDRLDGVLRGEPALSGEEFTRLSGEAPRVGLPPADMGALPAVGAVEEWPPEALLPGKSGHATRM